MFFFNLFVLFQVTPNLYALITILFHFLECWTCLNVAFIVVIILLLSCNLFNFLTHKLIFIFLLFNWKRFVYFLHILLSGINSSLLVKNILIFDSKTEFLSKIKQFSLFLILLTFLFWIWTENTKNINKKLLIWGFTWVIICIVTL